MPKTKKKHFKKIRQIGKDAYKKFPNQLAIDLIQDAENLLIYNCDTDENMRDKVGSHAYKVGRALDIYNPKFEHDISLLKRLKYALNDWCDAIETANKALGVPPQGRKGIR